MSRIQAHVHKLKRFTYKSTGHKVFFCTLDCGFKVDVGLALGKRTLCWVCGKEFPINEYSIRLARPRCNGCIKHKDTETPEVTNVVVAGVSSGATSSLKDRLKNLTFVAKEDEDI